MEIKENTLQTALEALSANAEQIKVIRTKAPGANVHESAQLLLIDKYQLTQTEAAEIVDAFAKGIESYRTLHSAMEADREECIKQNLAKATENMTDAERTRYLASMLSALELVSFTQLSQEQLDARLNANMAKDEAVLTADIVNALGTLPVDALAPVAEKLDAEAVAAVAEAVEKNSDDYRLLSALQLYMAERDGQLDLGNEPMSPEMMGSLAAGAVDAMLVTAQLKNEEITLEKWQQVLKTILGSLFVLACVCYSVTAALAVVEPIILVGMLFCGIWGPLAVLTAMFICIPLVYCITNVVGNASLWIVEKFAPVYDLLIVKITAVVKSLWEKICNWFKSRSGAPGAPAAPASPAAGAEGTLIATPVMA